MAKNSTDKQPSAKDRILKINWIDKGKPISKSGVEWIYDESIKELQKQHVQELKDQKAKIREIFNKLDKCFTEVNYYKQGRCLKIWLSKYDLIKKEFEDLK